MPTARADWSTERVAISADHSRTNQELIRERLTELLYCAIGGYLSLGKGVVLLNTDGTVAGNSFSASSGSERAKTGRDRRRERRGADAKAETSESASEERQRMHELSERATAGQPVFLSAEQYRSRFPTDPRVESLIEELDPCAGMIVALGRGHVLTHCKVDLPAGAVRRMMNCILAGLHPNPAP